MPFDGLTTERAAELEALLRMREMLAKPGGWCQGTAYRDSGRCLIQAIASAVDGHPGLTADVQARLVASLDRRERWHLFPTKSDELIRYNDGPRTTQADVVALIDRAIGAA